ncbi:MAG: hypothetical protein DMG82_24765, partial [Acidobacteria bacterium]
GLRPFFGLGSLGQGDGEAETDRNPKETPHEDDSWDARRHTWDASLGKYVDGWREVPGIFASSEGRHVQKSFGGDKLGARWSFTHPAWTGETPVPPRASSDMPCE